MDILEEERLGAAAFGSTRNGIAPVYGDKHMKKAPRIGDLLHLPRIKPQIEEIVKFKSLALEKVYGAEPLSFDEIWRWLECYAAEFIPYICDAGVYLEECAAKDKDILFEGQLGALLDIDFGIVPFTSSSNTIAAYAPIGAGAPGLKLEKSIGVTVAFSACVGEGPFVSEFFGAEADALRKAAGGFAVDDYGRQRRVGAFEVVASRYGCRMQGCSSVVLTMLDVLSYMDEIPVCSAYSINGSPITTFPYGLDLAQAKPVIKMLKGWKKDISKARKKEDLPKEALDYIEFIQQGLAAPIKAVSVGPEREAYISLV
jgi:adenylosuccinate synthase